jgi:hypothetical protein
VSTGFQLTIALICFLFWFFTFLSLLFLVFLSLFSLFFPCFPCLSLPFIMDINSLIAQTAALSWEDPSSQIESLSSENTSDECLPLAGHVISQRTHNNQSVYAALSKAWEFAVPFSFAVLGPNKFLFKFSKKEHLLRIQKQVTWNVNGYLLILQLWNPHATLGELPLNKAHLWIQIHGLPLINMTTKTAISIGKGLGKLLSVEDISGAATTFKSYLRVRVEIKAEIPLKPGFSFKRDNGEPLWVFLKYERLDIYCYSCGRLSHKSANCMATPEKRTPARYAISLKLNIFSNLLPSSPSSNTNSTINTSQTQPSNPHVSAMGLNQMAETRLAHNPLTKHNSNPSPPASSSKHQEFSTPEHTLAADKSHLTSPTINTTINTFSTASPQINNSATQPHFPQPLSTSQLSNQPSCQTPIPLDSNQLNLKPSLSIILPLNQPKPSSLLPTTENIFSSTVKTVFKNSPAKKTSHKTTSTSKKTTSSKPPPASPPSLHPSTPVNSTPPDNNPSLVRKKRARLSGVLLPLKRGTGFFPSNSSHPG